MAIYPHPIYERQHYPILAPYIICDTPVFHLRYGRTPNAIRSYSKCRTVTNTILVPAIDDFYTIDTFFTNRRAIFYTLLYI